MSDSLISVRPSNCATPEAICTMFTASRPQAAYRPVRFAVFLCIWKPARFAASWAMRDTSSGSKARKKISMQRERRAGEMSSGLRVVAPTRRKSAGSPSLKISCT